MKEKPYTWSRVQVEHMVKEVEFKHCVAVARINKQTEYLKSLSPKERQTAQWLMRDWTN